LTTIIHVQQNLESSFKQYPEWWQTHYFVEFDVTYQNQLSRFSHFIHVTPEERVCFMADWKWRENTLVNILTPLRNQFHWLQYLLEMLQNILVETKESRVSVLCFASGKPF